LAAPGAHDKTAIKRKTFAMAEFQVPARLADEAAGILSARGALGCAVQWTHRIRRSPHAPVTLQAFFTRLSDGQLRAHRAALEAAGMLDRSAIATPPVELFDPGWAAMWKARFKPLKVGRTLLIVPPWKSDAACTGRLPIIIDPGQGFGTGHHATTRSTLIAIESECSRRMFDHALDVGCGSGVLSLAMARLEVKQILALDNDPQALENARHNAELNGLTRRIRFSLAPLHSLRRPFPLIVANILSSTLIAMAPDLIRLLAPGGRLILSGILKREAAAVMAHYPPPLRRVRSHAEGGWITLVLARQ
jgi:ribosomal protein L11 methyltransferase